LPDTATDTYCTRNSKIGEKSRRKYRILTEQAAIATTLQEAGESSAEIQFVLKAAEAKSPLLRKNISLWLEIHIVLRDFTEISID